MSSTPSHDHTQPSRVPGMPRPSLDSWLPMLNSPGVQGHTITSGMATPLGLVLRVDRCAPEHGGGLLLHFPGDRAVVIISSESIPVYGIVSDEHLQKQRDFNSARTGIDYTAGLR